jgi:hypothetical protein
LSCLELEENMLCLPVACLGACAEERGVEDKIV